MQRPASYLSINQLTARVIAITVVAIVGFTTSRATSAAGLIYVDADPTAITPNIDPATAFSYEGTVVSNNSKWGQRTFGAVNPGTVRTIYESGISEDSPEVTQTIGDLVAGKSYDIYLAFWVGDSTSTADWQIYGGLASSNGDLANHLRFNRSGPTVQAPNAIAASLANTFTWATPPKNTGGNPIFHEDNRDMRLAFLGAAVANAEGKVPVYVNDSPATGTAFRSWLDGVAYVATAIPGDFDSDGDVDGADFVAWQTNFPKPTGALLAEGDGDKDGDVDGADFVVWQTNFPFPASSAASPIPEPSALFLASLASAFACLFRSKALTAWIPSVARR